MQLSRSEPSIQLYKNFIDGAGHAKRPELAREVYEMMRRNGIQPDVQADFLMLQSYLKSEKVSDALNFFSDICQRREVSTKLYNTLIAGLCRIGKADVAWEYMSQMKEKGLVPNAECYELLMQLLCLQGEYDAAFDAIADLKNVRCPITAFIGNVLLLHSLKSPRLYMAWARSSKEYEHISEISELGKLLRAFTGGIITESNAASGEAREESVPDLQQIADHSANMSEIMMSRKKRTLLEAMEIGKKCRQASVDLLEERKKKNEAGQTLKEK
ncbi:hypothetical protein NL676_015066 [Syzygium grande]|nr:hypothetical protein NL676_015066 [Syzygium grande]